MNTTIDAAKSYARNSMQLYRVMTNSIRLMPDFMIIGGQRCGTTSLYNYLIEHPGIVSASTKEIHFFDYNFAKGLGWYRAQFPSFLHKYYVEHVRKHDFLTGEATVNYLFHPLAPKRISEIMPREKLIVLLRNPIDRAHSQHWLESKWGHETLSFEEAIKCEEERLVGEREKMQENENYHSYNHRHFSYLARGVYVDQLQDWMNYYPREQFLILKSEDFYSDPAAVLQQTLKFLGIPNEEQCPVNKEYKQYREPHKKGYQNNEKPAKMDPNVREYLVEYFKAHNARLSEFLGRDFEWDK